MSTRQHNQNLQKEHGFFRRNDNESASQNNNGNIGREADAENEVSSGSANISGAENPVNEEAVGENQEHFWSGNYGHKSSNRPGSHEQDAFSDQNLTDGVQQNTFRNHVTNAGGTSQEDQAKGKTGLTSDENKI